MKTSSVLSHQTSRGAPGTPDVKSSYILPKLTRKVVFLGRGVVGFLVVLFTVRVGTLLLEPLLETCNTEGRDVSRGGSEVCGPEQHFRGTSSVN